MKKREEQVIMYLISIDSGKAQTKWSAKNNRTGQVLKGVFPTTIKAINPEQFGKIKTLVHYNGQHYSVGDAKDLKHVPEGTSKLNTTHEVCIYTAVAKALKELGANLHQTQSVHLCLNVPLRDYKDREERKKYQDRYFQEEAQETVSLTVDGQLVNFVVSELTLGYEGQGALIQASIQHPELELEEGYVLLADIGGHNDSVILFEDFAPVSDHNDALFNGVLGLFKSVSKTLSQRHDSVITMNDVELLSKGTHKFQAELTDFETVYNNKAEELLSDIKDNILTNTTNARFTKFVFAGGGAQALKELIPHYFTDLNYIILEDSQYANCLGMLEKALSEVEGE